MKTSNKILWTVVVVLLASAVPGRATAEAPLTLLPWNGAFFQVDKDDKSRLMLSYSQSFGSTLFDAKVSSRLDGSGTRADFLQGGGLAPGFQASVLVGYNHDKLDTAHSKRPDLCKEWNRLQGEGEKPVPHTDQSPDKNTPRADQQTLATPGSSPSREEPPPVQPENRSQKSKPMDPCTTDDYKEWAKKRVSDEQRERLIPSKESERMFFIGGEAAVSYDQVTALIGDLTSDSASFSQMSVTAGARFTLYATSFLAATLRAGYEYSDDVSYFEAERCTSLPSGEPSVTGTDCRKVNVLELDQQPAHSGYAEVAATALIYKEISDAIPGVEVRARLEGIGQARTLLIRPTFFIAPTTQPLTAKFGVGVEASRVLDAEPGGAPGQWQFTPFAVIGANLM
jgi:hypothetical protein